MSVFIVKIIYSFWISATFWNFLSIIIHALLSYHNSRTSCLHHKNWWCLNRLNTDSPTCWYQQILIYMKVRLLSVSSPFRIWIVMILHSFLSFVTLCNTLSFIASLCHTSPSIFHLLKLVKFSLCHVPSYVNVHGSPQLPVLCYSL